ncbi:MAG TPA: universal stress protein [Dehalococcoidia bacterium]|nr:universal stress protein [Dehalococcoidia bacterium]
MGKPTKIVVGYDGSEGARQALSRAAGLCGYGSLLTVVSVARSKNELEKARRLLLEASDQLLLLHTFARLEERVGEPVDELIAAAQENDADLIVVGNGKTRIERALHGSVSGSLIHRAPCDVLVARETPVHVAEPRSLAIGDIGPAAQPPPSNRPLSRAADS